MAWKSPSRCSRARGPEARAVQMPPPKSAPPKTAYMTSPRRTVPAARFSSVHMPVLLCRLNSFSCCCRPDQQSQETGGERKVDDEEGEEHETDAGLRCHPLRHAHVTLCYPWL